MRSLISPEELHSLIKEGSNGLRILDVRWRLDRPDGYPEYLEGHIPGAVYVDLDHDLADHGQPASEGRHPLPSAEALQMSAKGWGLNSGDTVVVYDEMNNTSSARAWWLLRHAGVEDVRALDGSLRSWVKAGFPLESGDVAPPPGNITLSYGTLSTLSMDEAALFPEHGTLLDARAPERYRGEHEPADPRAGHIPGAINSPTSDNVDREGRFLPPEELYARFLSLGVDPEKPVASYCGSGVTGAHSTLALELAGFNAALYPGSFSQWSNHPDRPVATGQQPG